MSNFKSVRKFMETFGQEIKEKASFPSDKITSLRYELIKEELDELKEAIERAQSEALSAFASSSIANVLYSSAL